MANKKNEICFLCGKTKNQTDRLIKGKYGYICGDCISAASDLILEEEQQSISTNDVKLVTPSQIKTYLDKYVVGQEEAKRSIDVERGIMVDDNGKISKISDKPSYLQVVK